MRKLRKKHSLAVVAVAGLALFACGFALAAVATVTLGREGPNPSTVTVQWGDTVSFQNGGDRPVGLTLPRITLASPVLQPGGSWQRVFDGQAGNYLFRQTEGRGFLGTVVVQLEGKVTMKAAPMTVQYGRRVVFSGEALAGHAVRLEQLVAAAAGQWVEVRTVRADGAGKWTTSLGLKLGARFRATAAAGQLRSQAASVNVQPTASLTRPSGATGGKIVTVRGRILPAGAATAADLERYDRDRSRWVREDRRKVSASGAVSFRWKAVKGRSQLRVQVQRYALKPGFEPVSSKPIALTVR